MHTNFEFEAAAARLHGSFKRRMFFSRTRDVRFYHLKSYQGYKDSVESLSDILMAIVLSYFLA